MIVDGMALLFRGYYATAYRGNFMKTNQGIPTNGVFQFLRYFFDAVNTFAPSHVICCWDLGSQTFRTDLYPGYKANRQAPPEELVPQFDLVKEVVAAFNIPNVSCENYEADDCIGTLAKTYGRQANHHVLILTGDQDMLQLVDEQVQVALMKKGIGNYDVYDSENFYAKKGIYPYQVIDFKGLTGDAADNYPGVKGIGEKTALKLLQAYETIDNLLSNLDNLSPSIQQRINENLDMLYLSRTLAKINCQVPISCSLEEAEWTYNKPQVQKRFLELELDHFEKYLLDA